MKAFTTPAWKHAGVFASILCCLAGMQDSHAMWAALSDEELVNRSALIVMGEWQAEPLGKGPTQTTISGTITITEVLKGKAAVSVRAVQPSAMSAQSSSDLVYRTGDRGLWLLRETYGSNELYQIDHPQRFVPVAGGEEKIRKLRQLICKQDSSKQENNKKC